MDMNPYNEISMSSLRYFILSQHQSAGMLRPCLFHFSRPELSAHPKVYMRFTIVDIFQITFAILRTAYLRTARRACYEGRWSVALAPE